MTSRMMEYQRLGPRGSRSPRERRVPCSFYSYTTRGRVLVPPVRCSATSALNASTRASPVSSGAGNSLTHNTVIQCVMPFILPATAAVATAAYAGAIPLLAGAPWLHPLLVGAGPLLLHVVIPLLDWLLGEDRHQPPPAAKAPAADDLTARLLPTLAIAAHLAVAAAAYAAVAAAPPPQPYMLALLLYSIGTSAAATMGAAHELVHSRHPLHLTAAAAFLTLHWWYPYYRAHHQHHLHVCTPVDYTCAPKGMNIYSYFRQYFSGSYAEAWELSVQECDRAGKPWFSHHNSTLVALVAQAMLSAAILAAFGPLGLLLHLGASAVLLSYIAIFDYVLHYGLTRPAEGSAGAEAPAAVVGGGGGSGLRQRYTRITPYTSWNSLYPLENGILFSVLLHSDHHLTASKSYGWLRPPPDAAAASLPTFPGPINLLALSVFAPPLWAALMDARADEANARHLGHLGHLEPAVTTTAATAAATAARAEAGAMQVSAGHDREV